MSDLRKAAQAVIQTWDDPAGTTGVCRALDALRAALAEPEPQPEVQSETEYNIGFKAGWEKGWHYGSMVENSACARIVELNAQSCANSPTLSDILNANALLIRARGNNEQ